MIGSRSIVRSLSLSLSLSVSFLYNEICMYFFINFLARVSLKLYMLFTHIAQIPNSQGRTGLPCDFDADLW